MDPASFGFTVLDVASVSSRENNSARRGNDWSCSFLCDPSPLKARPASRHTLTLFCTNTEIPASLLHSLQCFVSTLFHTPWPNEIRNRNRATQEVHPQNEQVEAKHPRHDCPQLENVWYLFLYICDFEKSSDAWTTRMILLPLCDL